MPHITDAIQEWVERVAKIPVDNEDLEPQCCIIEVGRVASCMSDLYCIICLIVIFTLRDKYLFYDFYFMIASCSLEALLET